MRRAVVSVVMLAGLTLLDPRPAGAQKPKPFPTPPKPTPEKPQPAADRPSPPPAGVPAEASLGVPIYPGAQFLASYDAGKGQRYYLFGATISFDQAVAYYRSVLKTRGELVFEVPPTYMFEVGRFREESMAFPPGVTLKDYTWGGGAGFPNPKPGGTPARFPTIIQIVPATPAR